MALCGGWTLDTEGSFIVERAQQIARGLCKFVNSLRPEGNLRVDKLLSGIHYFRIHDYIEQLAVVQTLPAFLKEHPKVRPTAMA